jgi:protein-disulfide isomerase
MCARSLIDGRSSATLIEAEEIIMPRPASQGDDVNLNMREGRFRSKPSGMTRRDLANLVGLAALAAFAPLALVGEAMAQAQPNIAIEPVSLPDMALGPRNAPVTIVDYSSMTCSHCAAFLTTVFPLVRSKYIDSGRVRFVFREFPLDVKAAAASMLARTIAGGDAERYFSAIDSLFRQQDQLIAQTTDTLQRVGRQYGMSQQAVDICLQDQALLNKLEVDRKIASEEVKITATPTFFINGQKNVGFMSFEDIERKIMLRLSR